MNPLRSQQSKGKPLCEGDIPLMLHSFRRVYGWISRKEWDEEMTIGDILSAWSFVNEEVAKLDSLRLCTLKFYGVKNPK